MLLLTKDKMTIVNLNRVATVGVEGTKIVARPNPCEEGIVTQEYDSWIELGEYDSEQWCKNIVWEIYNTYFHGKRTYAMP